MSEPSRPTVLLALANSRWDSLARAPRALNQAGFRVAVHAPEDHLIARSRFIDAMRSYPMPVGTVDYLRQLAAVIAEQQPVLVLAGDDVAMALLHRLRQILRPDHPACAVLDRSLPPRAMQDDVERKTRQVAVAAEIGVASAPSLADPAPDEAAAFAESVGYPVLVKLDFSWAGEGVRLCDDRPALLAALETEPKPLPFHTPVSRAVQAFVPGRDAFVTYAAHGGEMLAGFAMEKLVRVGFGPATVAQRLADRPALLEAAAAMVRRFGLSGVGDVEFRLEAGAGRPVFIEMNPRMVPVAHLGARLGGDVFAALARRFGGRPAPAAAQRLDGPVALFPGEWRRDPDSPYLRAGAHDVPWDEPELMPEDFKVRA